MIHSITIQVELMMYGFVGLNISATKEGVIASWLAVADGGNIISNEEIDAPGKHFDELALQLDGVDLPMSEDDEMSRAWDIVFSDENENIIKSIERGYWPIEILEQITELIDEFMNPDEVTEWLHDIIEV